MFWSMRNFLGQKNNFYQQISKFGDMIKHMRTTINMKDSIYKSIKEEAARKGTTITRIIEDRLEYAAMNKPKSQTPKVKLKSFSGDGLYPNIDLDSSAALIEIMDHIE